jgi:AcrR family transcriptional regulator
MEIETQPLCPQVILPGTRSPLDPERALRIGSRIPKSEVARNQRERLIDAMVIVCVNDGYEAAGVKATCEAAGIAYGTYHDHFETKEQLLLTAHDIGMSRLFGVLADTWERSDALAWPERVELAIRVFLQVLDDNPTFTRFFALEVPKAGSTAISRIDETLQSAFVTFGGITSSSALALTTDRVMALVIGGIYQSIYRAVAAGRAGQLAELCPDLTKFALNMLEPEEDAPPGGTEEPS